MSKQKELKIVVVFKTTIHTYGKNEGDENL